MGVLHEAALTVSDIGADKGIQGESHTMPSSATLSRLE